MILSAQSWRRVSIVSGCVYLAAMKLLWLVKMAPILQTLVEVFSCQIYVIGYHRCDTRCCTMNCTIGMRGDFLGHALLAWDDLEIGRELDLTLVRPRGVRGGSVEGTIKLLVGEPVVEVREMMRALCRHHLYCKRRGIAVGT